MIKVLQRYLYIVFCLANIFFCVSELLDLNRTSVFHSPFGFLDLHAMLLDEYQERLFVGGKDLVYSLSLEQISSGYQEVWEHQTVYQEGEKRGEGDNFLHGVTWISFWLLANLIFWVIILLEEIKYSWKMKSLFKKFIGVPGWQSG